MNEYLRRRVRASAEQAVSLARAEAEIPHKGLRGRLRELLVQNLLSPWLPIYAGCGTGMIVNHENRERVATQEDIVVFDRSLIPPVLVSSDGIEGVFPINGILARVEVKSRLTRDELRDAAIAAREVKEMNFAHPSTREFPAAVSFVFAFDTDLSKSGPLDAEFERLISVVQEIGYSGDVPSPIIGLCVAGRGFWAYGATKSDGAGRWIRFKRLELHDEILAFVGMLSNTCFSVHVDRQGRDPQRAIDVGIGALILTDECFEEI